VKSGIEHHFFSGGISRVGDSSVSYRPAAKMPHEEKWLGWLDSNQRSRDQNPLPCRLATPQQCYNSNMLRNL
jgi:hypothetical protein